MDLVRMILMRMETSPAGWANDDLGIKSFSSQEVFHHAHIMIQEGLIERDETTGLKSVPTSLTWKGHEFLDLARDQERWNRAKAIIAKVGGAPISVWMKVLTDLTMQGVDTAASRSN